MRRFLFLILFMAVSLSASAQSNSGNGNAVVMNIMGTRPPCIVTFKTGNITTEDCDFSLPLRSPKFTPTGISSVKIEFDQTSPLTLNTTSILVPAR